jgi:hypothetical protein
VDLTSKVALSREVIFTFLASSFFNKDEGRRAFRTSREQGEDPSRAPANLAAGIAVRPFSFWDQRREAPIFPAVVKRDSIEGSGLTGVDVLTLGHSMAAGS